MSLIQVSSTSHKRLLPQDVRSFREEFPVLVVDDDVFFRELVVTYLEHAGFRTRKATTVEEAESQLTNPDIRLVLCDFMMPQRNGLDLCQQLRAQEELYHYLVLMTGQLHEDEIVKGLQSGADDYINKNFSQQELIARLDCGVRVLLAQRLLENQQQELLYRVQHDELTGLYNRAYLHDQLPKMIQMAHRYQFPISIILLDIDHFKQINDQHGHLQGDAALKAVSAVIRDTIRQTDVAFRFGGEEFLIALPHCSESDSLVVVEKLKYQLSQATGQGAALTFRLTASYGVTLLKTTDTMDSLIHRADLLLYKSKAAGRNCWHTDFCEQVY